MLKKLVLEKKRAALQDELKNLRARRTQLRTEETEIQQELAAMPDTASVEDLDAISQRADENSRAQVEIDDKIADTCDKIDRCNAEIEAAEGEPAEDPAPANARSSGASAEVVAPSGAGFRCRSKCFQSRGAMSAFYAQNDVKDFVSRVRGMIGGNSKRSVNGAELTIPTVVLDVIRDNLHQYSKLIDRVGLRRVRGTSRQPVIGKIPEAVWTEMCAKLNELEFDINELELDGYKVGGFIPMCNAMLEDSDIALGEEILFMLSQSIGLALDKAIVYGLGAFNKMPVGIVTRLAQTSQPSYWGANQGAWTDLHSSNILKLNIFGSVGTAFFQPLLAAMGKARPWDTAGRATWIMNHKTHMDIVGRALAFNAAGALVAGMRDAMPVDGGDIVELEFIPDYEIVGGYMDMYRLAERDGGKFGYSDLPLYIQDKTVFKATARYDGQPVVGEAFVAINYNNTDVTTSRSFAKDYANAAMNTLIVTAAAGTASGDTVLTVAGAIGDPATLKYKAAATTADIHVGDKVTGFTALTSGTTQITAAAGTPIAVVELDANNRVISTGNVVAVPNT